MTGSSPLTRGGQSAATPSRCAHGLIPAYAGRTRFRLRHVPLVRAHPRLRGADSQRRHLHAAHTGSSPLTRGGPASACDMFRSFGLIPAYAGRTVSGDTFTLRTRAHPRLRGADLMPWRGYAPRSGSSPLTRGGLSSFYSIGVRSRLIPAYAGRTCSTGRRPPAARAHPRLRGADCRALRELKNPLGSSPLTRGGRLSLCSGATTAGLIPAYAGRTEARV